MRDIVERLRFAGSASCDLAADEIDRYRKATGGLPPALVAKALAVISEGFDLHDFTDDELTTFFRATFEVPE